MKRTIDASLEPAVRTDRLTKVYKTVAAVDGISFSLPRGSITGLLGGNGAGKTTTIAMLMGLTIPMRRARRACIKTWCRVRPGDAENTGIQRGVYRRRADPG